MLWVLGAAVAADFCAGFGGGPALELQLDPHRPPSAADTCWGQQYEGRYETEHFALEWSSEDIDSKAASVWGEKLEDAYTHQIEQLGFRAPVADGEYKTLVVLLPTSGRSYVAGAECPDGRELPYMVLHTEGVAYPDALAGHELNHVLQFAYDSGYLLWFWEATATWAQAQSDPNEKVWATSVVNLGFMDAPWLAMERSDRVSSQADMHMYGMAVWLFFLQQEQGDQAPEALWEAGSGTLPDELGIREGVDLAGWDFDALFADFVLANAHDLYDETFTDVALSSSTAVLPYDDTIGGNDRPETLGQSFARIEPTAISDEHGDLSLVVEADPEGDWLALVSAERVEGGLEVHSLDLSGGSAAVTIEDLSTTRGVVISMSPRAGELDRFSWSWSGDLTGPPPSDPRPGVGTFSRDTGGCTAARVPPGSLPATGLFVLLLVLLTRRRAGAD